MFFPVPEKILCSFSNVIFDIFWPKYKFGLCIQTWRREFGCLWLFFYLLKRFPLELYPIWSYILRIELPKLTSNIFMEIVTILVVAVDQFYFCMHQLIKSWFFEKIILWSSLSLHIHMVLKFACILLRQVISLKVVVLSAKFIILISWSPICIPLILLSALMKLALPQLQYCKQHGE